MDYDNLKSVVVCVDCLSLQALELAFKLDLKCKIFVLFVEIFTDDSIADPFHDKLNAVENYKAKNEGVKLKDRVLALIKDKLNYQFVRIESNDSPKTVIQKYCESNDVDMLIVGRSNSMIDHLLLGSTSKYLITHSKMPVLVAKSGPSKN